MMEIVFKFISNFMTITASTIQSALMAAMCQLSVIVFTIYYLLDYVQITTPLFYINLTGSILALILKTIVSRCQCLMSQNSFDLMEMQPYVSAGEHLPTSSTQLLPKSNTLPVQTVAPKNGTTFHPTRVSWNDLPSQAPPSPASTQSVHLLSPTTSSAPMHQHASSSSARSSHTQLYWYQVATSDSNAHRKSSAAAVIAYRIKYRLESIVSILK